MSRLLTYKQLAELLGIKEATLRKWFKGRHDVPKVKLSHKCVRFDESAIMQYFKNKFGVNMEVRDEV